MRGDADRCLHCAKFQFHSTPETHISPKSYEPHHQISNLTTRQLYCRSLNNSHRALVYIHPGRKGHSDTNYSDPSISVGVPRLRPLARAQSAVTDCRAKGQDKVDLGLRFRVWGVHGLGFTGLGFRAYEALNTLVWVGHGVLSGHFRIQYVRPP